MTTDVSAYNLILWPFGKNNLVVQAIYGHAETNLKMIYHKQMQFKICIFDKFIAKLLKAVTFLHQSR